MTIVVGVAQPVKRDRILEALDDMPKWDEWIASPECYLTPFEIHLLLDHRDGKTMGQIAREYNSHPGAIDRLLERAIIKLQMGKPLYDYWVSGKLPETAYRWSRDENVAKFLETHFAILPFTTRVYHALHSAAINFNELLDMLEANKSTHNVARLRGMGPETALYIRLLFQLNGCEELIDPYLGLPEYQAVAKTKTIRIG